MFDMLGTTFYSLNKNLRVKSSNKKKVDANSLDSFFTTDVLKKQNVIKINMVPHKRRRKLKELVICIMYEKE